MKLTRWQRRILKALGISPQDRASHQAALGGRTKHGRQHRKPRDWREKRKKRRQIARASRRRNR